MKSLNHSRLAALLTLTVLLTATGSASFAEQNVDKDHFTIAEVRTEQLTPILSTAVSTSSTPIGALGCESTTINKLETKGALTEEVLNPLKEVELIVDQIINIGKKVFAIVEAGRPVVNLKLDVATALPTGSRCWMDLQQWQVPQSKVYSMKFINNWGSEVVRMTYRVLWLPGGTVDGVGKYIGYATMAPVDLSVSWGFNLDADVAIPTVFNMGTKAEPVAGMQMNMHYSIRTPVQHTEQGQAFFVNGQGLFEQLQ